MFRQGTDAARVVFSDLSGAFLYSVQDTLNNETLATTRKLSLEAISGELNNNTPAKAVEDLIDLVLGGRYQATLDAYFESVVKASLRATAKTAFSILATGAVSASQMNAMDVLMRQALMSDSPTRLNPVFAMFPGVEDAMKDAMTHAVVADVRSRLERIATLLTSYIHEVMRELLEEVQTVMSFSFIASRLRPAAIEVGRARLRDAMLDVSVQLYADIAELAGR